MGIFDDLFITGEQVIPNPAKASASKASPGFSDVVCSGLTNDLTYNFLGCPIVNISANAGYNSVASSATITVVEDPEKNKYFNEPVIPSILAVSLPKGGVGTKLFHPGGIDLNPHFFYDNDIPFYFAGICTSWEKPIVSTSEKTITVTIADPREILSGVQCLLGSFALSQELGTGSARQSGVANFIDCFGYYNYGLSSELNEYGMKWNKIRVAIEAARVTLLGVSFEFVFNGSCFQSPDWYRIPNDTMDLVTLAVKVANDGGSDVIFVGRKLADNYMLVEIRGISRSIGDPLTKDEIQTFINDRSVGNNKIVSSASTGREFRNEPMSPVVVGGLRNSNYVAYPTKFNQSLHSSVGGFLDYADWPEDIKERLFTPDVGAIFPFWGMDPTNTAPLAEPFLRLDHLAFDKFSKSKGKIPLCRLEIIKKQVRSVPHSDVFITNDGTENGRPFCQLADYTISDADQPGWHRGLPLNTEILKAALVDIDTFKIFYSLFYPDIAEKLEFGQLLDLSEMNEYKDAGGKLEDYNITEKFNALYYKSQLDFHASDPDNNGFLEELGNLIYTLVLNYAKEYMGSQFVAILPRSFIMERIWKNQFEDAGLSIPTRVEAPEIEYKVDELGYWETLPTEFDGLGKNGGWTDTELQIIQRFMATDGRFYPMAVMNYTPRGNASFLSSGGNNPLFQDIQPSEYRPNRIAEGTPERIYIACNISVPQKRPDIAIVRIPPVEFDPTEFYEYDEQFLNKSAGIIKFFRMLYEKNYKQNTITFQSLFEDKAKFTEISKVWASKVSHACGSLFSMETEPVLDLDAIIIPLTSSWLTYGPWYYQSFTGGLGMADIVKEETLVPWNFERSIPWDHNLNIAGNEALARGTKTFDYVDKANITVAGFPEIGLSSGFGYNSNLTSVNISFGIGGITTTYNFSNYNNIPGTYRKSEHDNLTKARIPRIPPPEIINTNITWEAENAGLRTTDQRNKFNL